MISQEAIQIILGIEEKINVDLEQMADKLNVTFSPINKEAKISEIRFSNLLKESLKRLKVNIVPYEDAWEDVSFSKRLKRFVKYYINNITWIFRKIFGFSEVSFYLSFSTIRKLCSKYKIKKGIAVICTGQQNTKDLMMHHISNFKTNSIITIIELKKPINESADFESHFHSAMDLFAYHMTNIVIGIDSQKWLVYNFNASHPIYSLEMSKSQFDLIVLKALISKVVAPITPHKFKEFIISDRRFKLNSEECINIVDELRNGAKSFSKTKLYPPVKKIDELPFRDNFHKLVGKMHLDSRSGMSFGYLAHQMPTKTKDIVDLGDFRKYHSTAFRDKDYFTDKNGDLYILVEIENRKFVLNVPEVWVMTLRSGSDKTNFIPDKDLIEIGLINGKMHMRFPDKMVIDKESKPSFDTKIILAHAVGNALVSTLAKFFDSSNRFSSLLSKNGISISHWHGYFNRMLIPKGMVVYGHDNPHVSCSSPHAAIYALDGKLKEFNVIIKRNEISSYIGDIHIEPHHGININFFSSAKLAEYILDNPEATALGNKYL